MTSIFLQRASSAMNILWFFAKQLLQRETSYFCNDLLLQQRTRENYNEYRVFFYTEQFLKRLTSDVTVSNK